MGIVYRNAVEADAEKIVAFYHRVGGETNYLGYADGEYSPDVKGQLQHIRNLDNKTNTMLLAVDGEEIVGIATIASSHRIKIRHTGELGIVVAKKYHGQGIGTELIKRLVAWCAANGVTTKISLVTRADNVSAVGLYLKLGFVVEGCLKNHTLIDGTYYDAYIMGLML
ncbi:MAG: GNAT family N-acetyltransferase [Oscillospiraceae bacterium]|nr:GNAT family N-acetyltransferase [Oscillospiraceae bacterium]